MVITAFTRIGIILRGIVKRGSLRLLQRLSLRKYCKRKRRTSRMGIKVSRVKITITEATSEQLWPPSLAAILKAAVKVAQLQRC